MLTPRRDDRVELLDDGVGSDEDVERNLNDLRRINRIFGATRLILSAVDRCLDRTDTRDISLLDVGTGSADIPHEILQWCNSRGIAATVASLDLSERNLRVTKSKLGVGAGVELIRADARLLPFASRSVDFITASQFLHHFSYEGAVSLVGELARVAKRAVIISDLTRSLVPYWFVRAAGPLIATSFLTRNDGPLSVLRGFTPRELSDIAARAGLKRFRVSRVFPYRLCLVARLGLG
jgi:ubiquinone/menaquinone biosynthesis C-methylase UbiE